MTLLKILATLFVAALLAVLALPSFAANDKDGVAGGPSSKPSDPAAKPRRHHRHDGSRRPRPKNQNGSPQAPAPQRTYYGGTEIG